MGRPRKVKEVTIDDALLMSRAIDYAKDCGMKGTISSSTPVQAEYGWEITVQNEKGVTASLRFTKDGLPSYWEVTSR